MYVKSISYVSLTYLVFVLLLIIGQKSSYCAASTDANQATTQSEVYSGFGPGPGRISLKEEAGNVVINVQNPHIFSRLISKDLYTAWDSMRDAFGFGPSKKTKNRIERERQRRKERVLPPYLIEVSNDGKTVTFKTALHTFGVLKLKGAPVASAHRGVTISKNEYIFTVTLPKEYVDKDNSNFASVGYAKTSD